MGISIYNVVLSVIAAIVTQKIVALIYRYTKTCLAARKFPGLPGTQLIKGNLQHNTVDEYLEKATKFVQTTEVKLHTLWVYFLYPVYSISHPDYVKRLLKSSTPKDDNVGAAYTMLRPWIAKGQSVEISNPVTIATLDSLLRCALSYSGNIQEAGNDHPYVDAVQKLAGYFNDRILNPILYPDFIFYRTKTGRDFKKLCDYVHKFAEDIIKKRRQSLQSDVNKNQDSKVEYRKRKLDFLDILLTAKDDQGRGLTDLQIRSEVDTFMFAGHDTTSSAISWAIYALGKYPDIQDKVYEEVILVAGDQPIKWEDLTSLKYQSLFIKEVMRMYSIVPLIGRITDEPLTLDGATIPADSIIELNIHALNHRKDVWLDYDNFRPERFEEPSGKGRDPFSFIPFSAGARNCIGQHFATNEIKVIISRLVQTYKIEVDQKHEVVPSPQLVMRPKNGIKVFLHQR